MTGQFSVAVSDWIDVTVLAAEPCADRESLSQAP
jgi:hypothetical protein